MFAAQATIVTVMPASNLDVTSAIMFTLEDRTTVLLPYQLADGYTGT